MNGQQIAMLLRQEMQHLPRVQGGGQPYLSNETNQILIGDQSFVDITDQRFRNIARHFR